MKLLITGANGQLGMELKRLFKNKNNIQAFFFSRSILDICDILQLRREINEINPEAIINAAAYTAVESAENNVQSAILTNSIGPLNIASICKENEIYLLHISTNFVFSGNTGIPYQPYSLRDPLGVYGQTKSEGEINIERSMQKDWSVIRTAWVYSNYGRNFVKTMLEKMSQKKHLNIICDQYGSPTWARSLAQICWEFIKNKFQGIYHWTDAGVASWYDFAIAIQDLALEKGLLNRTTPITPVKSCDYPSSAPRPHFGVLDNSLTYHKLKNIPITHWRNQLNIMLNEVH